MGRARTIARRSFMIGSAAILGGVAFGVYIVRKPHDNPLKAQLDPGEVTFNPYVTISEDGIRLITTHVDFGQGVRSIEAALIAEELDVELDQFQPEFAAPDPAYYNTANGAELVPFAAFDDSFVASSVRSAAGASFKVLGLMATGGSSTIPDQYTKLRQAGAVARETLRLAASRETGTAVEELRTARAKVILPDGQEISYTDLAATASGLDPVTNVTLREPSEWRFLGKPMQRLDILAKSTGELKYGIDQNVAGMVHAAIRVNPRRGGTMNSYDASAAEAMRGVRQIVPVTGGVAVIADNTWRAFKAANAITFDWGQANYPEEMDGHWQILSDSFVEDRLDRVWRDDGDVAGSFDAGDVITAEYRAPYVAHQPLEPLSAIVLVSEDSAEVWAGSQLPRYVQQKVAAIAGLDPDAVTFHQQFVGGSFGHRQEFENITLAAEIAVQILGTPVKLTFTREEDFALDFPRQIGISRSRGAVRDGQVDSWELDIATASVTDSQSGRLGLPIPGPDGQIAAGAWNMPYAIPNLRVRAYRVPGLAPVSSWRSVGASSAAFFSEGFLDELIRVANADPMEERLRLVNNDVHRKVLEAVAEMSNWGGALGENRGRGLALVESFGVPVAEVIDVTMTDRGIRIDNVWVAADVGRVLDPVNFDNQVKGGVIWGLGHAMNSEITYADGMPQQTNYHEHEGMRLYQCPQIEVRGLENNPKIRGVGEPPVPPAAPALASAIFDATGMRLREMPFHKFIDFV